MGVFAVLLIVLVACAGPAPESDETSAAEFAAADFEAGEDLEKEDELEIPPEGSLPLSEIIANFEIAGHTAVTEVEFEDGVWEVEFVVGDEKYALEIDPMTGEALSDEPQKPDDD
jgi:hypothetical protein